MRRAVIVLFLVVTSWVVQTGRVYAEEAMDKSVRKLGRGLMNVATGWLELPMQLSSGMSETGGVEGFFLGLGKGAVWTVFREGAGAIETATFFIPVPEDYGPLMQPSTVFDY